ncbi:ArsR family transcriptional regulator [Actinomyces sp. 2119]|uniref:ArsR family transcriptional regulator n=1 Tax=Actinomyces lilanjuaniae TaxID=2321394 RepID=A0ABM6Z1G3_9ACTO|nr:MULTISPECIES: metalloregulator ArsR/SmtB family transcription factor [Actinomyces]AYD89119.1 ArsR family transcriptional regulator [Actinomyces lilanjuaniae]RJF41896.1 ArsR family transcriptional regulator [Actinomyces sp. 2119]
MAAQAREPQGSQGAGEGRPRAGGAPRQADAGRLAPGRQHAAPGAAAQQAGASPGALVPELPQEGASRQVGAGAQPEVDQALRALADGNRRAILEVIRAAPQPVGVIAQEVGLSQQAASHHLGVLSRAGLAVSAREGTRHLYAVRTDGLAAVRSYLDGFWPTRLAALKAAVEEGGQTREAPRGRESRGEPGEFAGHG